MLFTMSSSVIMILCLGLMTETLTNNYFNRKIWFDHGNIFHIQQEQFRMVFQQHRNVNRHIHWLTNEISSLNHQIKLIKEQVAFVIHPHEQPLNSSPENQSLPLSPNHKPSLPITKTKNHRNIYILKLLSNESLFDGYIPDLINIYELSLLTTIECIAVIIEHNSIEKYLFIKLSNGIIDKYVMHAAKSLKETLWKITQPITVWNNEGKQPEYYRRFIPNNQTNEIILPDQLIEIKTFSRISLRIELNMFNFALYSFLINHLDRPKLNDVHFFEMMGQILRIKYHTDPSSLSCILEVFFGNIYTCDGRLIQPYELKLLSGDNNLFVFYAIMMDTITEKQIYPLDTNNHIRYGDQIFFLFSNHPQFNSLSLLTCPDCPRPDQTYALKNNEGVIEQNTDNRIIESKSPFDNILQHPFLTNPQNYIVYIIVLSISIYILLGIYISRRQECLGKRQSISSRRGR